MEHEHLERFRRVTEVLAILGISRSTLNQWIQDGVVPRPVKIGGPYKGAVRWRRSDIERWLKKLQPA